MIRTTNVSVDRVMADTGMERLQAWRHENQRHTLVRRAADDLRARAAACVEAYAARSAGSIADVIALEHAAGDEAHVTGLPLEHCQRYVRRNAALVNGLKEGGAA